MLYVSRISESGDVIDTDVLGADFGENNPDIRHKVKEINNNLLAVGYHIEDVPDGKVVIANSDVKRSRLITDLNGK